jgi:hypothetical protein
MHHDAVPSAPASPNSVAEQSPPCRSRSRSHPLPSVLQPPSLRDHRGETPPHLLLAVIDSIRLGRPRCSPLPLKLQPPLPRDRLGETPPRLLLVTHDHIRLRRPRCSSRRRQGVAGGDHQIRERERAKRGWMVRDERDTRREILWWLWHAQFAYYWFKICADMLIVCCFKICAVLSNVLADQKDVHFL